MKSTLPEKPSELIRLALADLRKCEVDPRYKIDMSCWHMPTSDICHVCLAGSVMAGTLQLPKDKCFSPSNVPVHQADVASLRKLNEYRFGYQIDTNLIANERKITFYLLDKEQFHSSMEAFAKEFESVAF